MLNILKRQKTLLIIITLLSFLGFLDAAYLTIKHSQGVIPPCSVSDCENVLTSQYATVGNIPISLLGSIYYIAVIGLSILLLQKGVGSVLTSNFPLQRILFLLIFSGFIVSVALFLIQALIIHSFCQYCLFSEAISVFLLIFSIILLSLRQKQI